MWSTDSLFSVLDRFANPASQYVQAAYLVKAFSLTPGLVLASPVTLQLLANAPVIHVDGTHNVISENLQVVSCCAQIGGRALPLAFLLCQSKTTAAYTALLQELRTALGSQPRVFMVDFEDALQSAIRAVWPQAAIKCCYFHLLQACKRWLDSHTAEYDETQQSQILNIVRKSALTPYTVQHEFYNAQLQEFAVSAGATSASNTFWTYFSREFMPLATSWARCFNMDNADMTLTNNVCESLFRRLKANVPQLNMRLEHAVEYLCNKELKFSEQESSRIQAGKVSTSQPAPERETISLIEELTETDALRQVASYSVAVARRETQRRRVLSTVPPSGLGKQQPVSDTQHLRELLAAEGLRLEDVVGRGNCVFGCYLRLLGWRTRDIDTAALRFIRRELAHFLDLNFESFRDSMETHEFANRLRTVTAMRTLGIWQGNLAHAVFARWSQINLVVLAGGHFTSGAPTIVRHLYLSTPNSNPAHALAMAFVNDNHYQVISAAESSDANSMATPLPPSAAPCPAAVRSTTASAPLSSSHPLSPPAPKRQAHDILRLSIRCDCKGKCRTKVCPCFKTRIPGAKARKACSDHCHSKQRHPRCENHRHKATSTPMTVSEFIKQVNAQAEQGIDMSWSAA
jgi:hypothetical protein